MGSDTTRKVVVQLYSNTIADGGETEFYTPKKRINALRIDCLCILQIGHIRIEVISLKGDKYILTPWLEELNDILSNRQLYRKCKHTDCVEVCPVDCFHEGENFLAINPEECIDCGVCEPRINRRCYCTRQCIKR